MEEMQALTPDLDFGASVLERFKSSSQEDHRHICTVIGSISQELKDHKLPSTLVAYFCSICDCLERLISSGSAASSPHIADSLITMLPMLLPKLQAAVVLKKRNSLSNVILNVLTPGSVSPTAAVPGLKCLAHVLITRDSDDFTDISQLYNVLVSFVTDSDLKVRKQAHRVLRDVLQSFQHTRMLAAASEAVTNSFEKLLLLACESSASANAAHQVLHLLDAFKECLPLLSMKCGTVVIKKYKTLLELRQPMVTRRVTNSLNEVCVRGLNVSPEPLLDVLCALAVYVSSNETSVDNMTFTAKLLDAGINKVYALNRQICVVKLPAVFNTLKDILGSDHEEAIFAATCALKNLINNCVDERLIKQGVDQITIHKNADKRASGPTIIEKLCITVESLLDYHFGAVWDMVFQVVSTMFDKLGKQSSYFMSGTLKNLADMQKLPDEDFPYRKQLHDCLGSALSAMGPERFLNLVPLKIEADDLNEVNVWLFPILKQYTVGAHLSFFAETVLGMISLMKQKSRKLESEGRIISARTADALAYSLWSLLPSFCNYALDTAEAFKDLENALSDALKEDVGIRGIVCSALNILIQQNKKIAEDKDGLSNTEDGIATQQAIACYTPEVALNNLSVLKSFSRELMTVMLGILLESPKDGGCLQSTISEFASIADKAVVRKIFSKVMRKLKDASQKAATTEGSRNNNSMLIDEKSPLLERAQLFDLAVSLSPGLDGEGIGVLFIAVKPALQDAEGLIQKKAYKALSLILQVDGLLSLALEDLLQLMNDVMPFCHFSAKRYRLDCLYHLIVHVSKVDSELRRRDILCSFLNEIILALKEMHRSDDNDNTSEANKKTRNRAYDVLVQIGHACGDEENGGKRENLYQLFNMVAGGIAGETPHMISAATKGVARLAYEFSDLVSTAYKLLPSTFLLLQRKNREIIKANLGFLKVLVAKSQAEGLQMHLGSMVEGMLKWQDGPKNHFKSKIKHLLEMLVKKCGLEAVRAVMPEEHMKLLTNIRKVKERREKKLSANSEDNKSHLSRATTSRLSRWNHSKIFSDFGEETEDSDAEFTDMKTVTGRQSRVPPQPKSKVSLRSRRMHKSLPDDSLDQMEEEPLNLLDRYKTRSALRSSENSKRKQEESDDEPEIDSEGRLVVSEGGKRKMEKPSERDSDTRSEAASRFSANSSRKNLKRQRTSDSGWAYTGKEYASKKAGGDVKKKDKLEPYAYWPLDRKMMSRRPEHQAAARKGMSSIVKMTKKFEGKSASSALSMKSMKFKKLHKKKGGGQKKSR